MRQFYTWKMYEFDWKEGQWYDFFLNQILNYPDFFGEDGKIEQIGMAEVTTVARRKAKEAMVMDGKSIMVREVSEGADIRSIEDHRDFLQWIG